MSYQVLARKWRPRRFEDMIGQQHVLQALMHGLAQGRLHHAYLFSGTRGVGKTTVARILAKAINCETGVTPTPCGECASCREIDEGRFIDLIEVDAASRTKVDETRELLENVHYAPTRGRYKVYLIDEVQMFSNHSFNALLKTLEEPPPHVKFLLATTDPKKLPVTILSRCLQFNLRRLPAAQIAAHLEKILAAEGVAVDQGSARLLAEAADGSVRDALSLLDQAIAYGGGELREADVRNMLGAIDRRHVFELLGLIADRNAAEVIAHSRRIAEANPDFVAVLGELLSLLQRVAVVQVLGNDGKAIEDNEQILDIACRMSPEDCQLCYQIGLIGRRDLPLAPDPAGGFEMVLLRMLAFRPPSGDVQVANARVTSSAPEATHAASAQPAVGGLTTGGNDWPALIAELGLSGRVKELAAQCVFQGMTDGRFRLALSPTHANLRGVQAEQRLEQAIQARCGEGVRLALSVQEVGGTETPAQARSREELERERAAAAAIENDPNVVALRESFGAVIESTSPREQA
ncbi:MAG: DNA polymerase III subunit gamma/tau [Chromatiales bacterium]